MPSIQGTFVYIQYILYKNLIIIDIYTHTHIVPKPHIVFKLRKIVLNIYVKKKKKTFIPIKAGLCKCSQAALLFNSIRMNGAAACNHAVNRN